MKIALISRAREILYVPLICLVKFNQIAQPSRYMEIINNGNIEVLIHPQCSK